MTSVQASNFHISPLSTQYQQTLIEKKLWNTHCPVPLSRLRDVTVSYYDFNGKIHTDGHIIVLDAVAEQTSRVFQQLFNMQFPIHSIKPTSDFDGDDDRSMLANNSSAFNCREITGGGKPSLHTYGVAIDINPVQNPYIRFEKNPQEYTKILPPNAQDYIKRQPQTIGMVEPIVEIFKQNGFFEWGGHWKTLLDYQHFQPSRLVSNLLVHLSPEDASQLFTVVCQHSAKIAHLHEDQLAPLLLAYQHDRSTFMDQFLLGVK